MDPYEVDGIKAVPQIRFKQKNNNDYRTDTVEAL